ncbi:MAG: hypothetical protein AAB605_03685 [Patescibacteria group bacterium]
MFIYQKIIGNATVDSRYVNEGREYTITLLTIRQPAQMIPSHCVLVGEVTEDDGVLAIRKIPPVITSWEHFPEETDEALLSFAKILQNADLGEHEEVKPEFAMYFSGGGWWCEVVAYTADAAIKYLKEQGFTFSHIS